MVVNGNGNVNVNVNGVMFLHYTWYHTYTSQCGILHNARHVIMGVLPDRIADKVNPEPVLQRDWCCGVVVLHHSIGMRASRSTVRKPARRHLKRTDTDGGSTALYPWAHPRSRAGVHVHVHAHERGGGRKVYTCSGKRSDCIRNAPSVKCQCKTLSLTTDIALGVCG